VRRVLREPMRRTTQLVGERCATVELEEQAAKRTRTLCDARMLRDFEPDFAAQGIVQRHGMRRAAERGSDRRQALDGVGVGEESRRGAQGSHAGTMPAREGCSVIVSLRAAPELCSGVPARTQ